MEDNTMFDERDRIESEIRGLISQLEAPTSDIGDWKIVKCFEAQLLGNEMPYDLNELSQQRQAVRDRINELQDRLRG